jgi:hypothetical protein
MVIPNPDSKPYPVIGDDGQVIGYLVPAEQMKRMQDEIALLREQLAKAIEQRDHHLAHLVNALKTLHPVPPTEEEMLAAVDNSHVIDEIIASLEARPG